MSRLEQGFSQVPDREEKPTVYDLYPNGLGEVPPDYVPVQLEEFTISGVTTQADVKKVRKEKKPRREKEVYLRGKVEDLHSNGEHVALGNRANKILIFAAKHRTALVAFGAIGGALGTTVGGFYLTRRSPRKK